MAAKQVAFRSISTRFIVLTIVMVVILFGGLGVFIAWQNAEALRASLKSKSTSVAELASLTGAENLANFNYVALDHLVNDIVADPEVGFAAFYNDKDELLTKRDVPKSMNGLQVVARQLKSDDIVLGTLKIGYKQDLITQSLYKSIITVAAGTLAAIVLFSLGIAITTRRIIVTPLKQLGVVIGRIASGDLSHKFEIASQDEVGVLTASLNGMVGNLNQMVAQIRSAAGELNSVATELTGITGKVVNAADMQSAAVAETSSAVTEINASVKGVAYNVDQLSTSASESSSSILEMTASVTEVANNTEVLSKSVGEVGSSIVQMAAAVKQVESSVQSLELAAASTSSSVLEMDYTIKQVEQNAAAAATISDEVRGDAERGRLAVEAAIVGINEIGHASKITSEVIASLSDRANAIGVILSVIDEVADQTNLLALNAAIIAAQAGEHGKGFAVVADEIKELAERTSSSTQEITKVINAVQDETKRAVNAICSAEKSIADGKELTEKSGAALSKIFLGVDRTTDQIREIARATLEQSRGSQMIRESIEQVSEMVSQIAKATREQSQGSELIIASAERMKQLTEQVRNSTQEQTKVGGFIARSTENITHMIANINRACGEQTRGSEQIGHSVEDVRLSASINLDATKVMNEVANKLFRQIEILREQMAVFKV